MLKSDVMFLTREFHSALFPPTTQRLFGSSFKRFILNVLRHQRRPCPHNCSQECLQLTAPSGLQCSRSGLTEHLHLLWYGYSQSVCPQRFMRWRPGPQSGDSQAREALRDEAQCRVSTHWEPCTQKRLKHFSRDPSIPLRAGCCYKYMSLALKALWFPVLPCDHIPIMVPLSQSIYSENPHQSCALDTIFSDLQNCVPNKPLLLNKMLSCFAIKTENRPTHYSSNKFPSC